jgi:hypothetical protein
MLQIKYFRGQSAGPRCRALALIAGAVLIVCLSVVAEAADQVQIHIAGGPMLGDTLLTGVEYEIQFIFENDQVLGAISHGFTLTSTDGVEIQWLAQPDGYGSEGFATPPATFGIGVGHAAATVVPGCRMAPPNSKWDMTDFLFTERDMDGVLPDTFMLGGVAMMAGMSPGPPEHMISVHFTPTGPTGTDVWMLCIDSCFVPPYGDFVFSFLSGIGVTPAVNWPPGGLCIPVKEFPNACPEWDSGLPTVLTADHCGSGTILLTAHDAEDDSIMFEIGAITGGAGTAEIDDNGEGVMTLTYHPDPSEMGEAISIDVNIGDAAHGMTRCTPYTVVVDVTNVSPQIDCGASSYLVHEGNTVGKTDIARLETDLCDITTYFLASGNGSIDPTSGDYSWMLAGGVGTWPVTVGITDGFDTALCAFDVVVVAGISDTCSSNIQYPGDVNGDGSINVIDLNFLIGYLYQGGAAPPIMANADINGDCVVDDRDMAYLRAALFAGGPPPVSCTCINPVLCECIIADANGDLDINVADAVYIINFVFKGGAAPVPYAICSGDANKDCACNIGDAVYLINYVFKSGPPPPTCPEWLDEATGCGWVVR